MTDYYEQCFEFGSLTKKYEGFTGKKWNYSGNNDTQYLKNNFPMVSLEGNTALMDQMVDVRNWCQDQFGDRWIYDWNDFYFHTQEDANWFALRWS
jgi:hypothetical protein